MKIEPKSQEVIQAQVAAFATEQNEDHRNYVLANIGDIGLRKSVGDLTVTSVQGQEHVIASGSDYVEFLRREKRTGAEAVSMRADLLKSYDVFAPMVQALRDDLSDLDKKEQNEHPAFLGAGGNSRAFTIRHQGKQFVVRRPGEGYGSAAGTIDDHLDSAVLGKDIPHLEKIVVASYGDGVTVAELMPGKQLLDLKTEELRNIPTKHIDVLVDTVIAMHEHDVGVDPNPENIFYDKDQGFGVIDFHRNNPSADRTLGKVVGGVCPIVRAAFFKGKKSRSSENTLEGYSFDADFHKANIEFLSSYRSSVVRKLKGEDLDVALENINNEIAQSQVTYNDYSDAEWVTRKVAGEIGPKPVDVNADEVW